MWYNFLIRLKSSSCSFVTCSFVFVLCACSGRHFLFWRMIASECFVCDSFFHATIHSTFVGSIGWLERQRVHFYSIFYAKVWPMSKGHHYFRFQNGLSYRFFVMFAIIKLPLCDFLVFFVSYAWSGIFLFWIL